MKILIWTVFGLLAGVWTLMSWLLARLAGWLAQWMAGGAAAPPPSALTEVRLPAWLLDWVDVGTLQALQQAVLALLEALRGAGPWLGDALHWLQPAVWGLWALGLLVLLAAAGGLHLLLRVATPAPPGARAPAGSPVASPPGAA
ncbi:hypothetical protein BurJ1DRAFT_0029 [Burkholderiales bacterium JOSHI_001]|nr:hypothetical protein BurJ1DRAFT_0029 [Burkholderiales bacterium JOSHI_001]